MQGDYSRVPYKAADNITRVLFQQGRPLVEADLNDALLMLEANQATLLGLHAKGEHGPLLVGPDAFKVALNADSTALTAKAGTIAFDGLVLRERAPSSLSRFREISLDPLVKYYVVTEDARDPDKVDDDTYVLAVAAIERQMLLSEIADRHADIVQFRAANLWTLDWEFVLVPVLETDGTPGAISTADVSNLRDKLKDLDSDDPPSIHIRIKTADKARFAGRLLRLEVHTIDAPSDPKKVTLKLAFDNASHTFRVQSSNGPRINFLPAGIDPGDFPAVDEWVEAETRSSIDWLDGNQNELRKVTSADGTELFVNNNIALKDADQIRRWSFVFADKDITTAPAGAPDQYLIKTKIDDGLELEVTLPKSDASSVSARLLPGDAWSFKIDGFKDDDTGWTKFDSISGFRKRRFFAPIGVWKYATAAVPKWTEPDNGSGAPLSNGVRNALATLLSSQPEGPAPLTLVAARSAPASRDSVASYVNEVTVSRFFPKASTVAMRKWLASATWGELAGLSAADLRERVFRDCDGHGCDNDQLESDLRMVVSQRQKLLNHPDIALA